MVPTRWHALLLVALLASFWGTNCNPGPDPAGDGTLQLFFDVNVDAAATMGLADLSAIVVQSNGLTAKFTGPGGPNLVLDSLGGTTTLPAHDRLIPGPSYAVAPGFITELRIENPIVTFQFSTGPSVSVRVPSGPQSGWKVVVDESVAPNGYQIVAGKTTGVRLFVTLGDLFHKTGNGNGNGNSNTWMARPTINSTLYNITASGGYDPDILVVVFDPSTSDTTIQNAIATGGYTVVNMYPGLPKLYKIKLPPGGDLQAAHMYFRALPYVLAAGPSAVLKPRADTVPPSEGTPIPLRAANAVPGWMNEVAANVHLRGTVGVPDAVVAEISFVGINTHHDRLLRNIWLNQGEITWKCPLTPCDVDGDGFVTLRDFNAPNFTGTLPTLPPTHTGPITCDDLVAPGSGYSDGKDNDNNGFIDDICGWNFGEGCIGPPCSGGNTLYAAGGGCVSDTGSVAAHDTEVTGIIGALPNMAPTTTPYPGGGVGVCWNCRVMVLAGMLPEATPQTVADLKGFTFEYLAALAYATQNGAHVVNFSAGALLQPSNQVTCTGNRSSVDKAAFTTVTNELDQLLSSALTGAAMKAGNIPPLFTNSIEDNCGAPVDDNNPNNYDYPMQAFRNTTYSLFALSVVGSVPPICPNCTTSYPPGPAAALENLGADLAAPQDFTGVLDDTNNSGIACRQGGSSFAAPLVAGVAGLVVSGNLAMFSTPNGFALRQWLLGHEVVTNPALTTAQVPSQDEITMQFLP